MSVATRAVNRDINRNIVRYPSGWVRVHSVHPFLGGEVSKRILSHPIISITKLGYVIKGVPQEVTVDAITGEGHVDSCASFDDIWAGDVGIVIENFWDALPKDVANVSEV